MDPAVRRATPPSAIEREFDELFERYIRTGGPLEPVVECAQMVFGRDLSAVSLNSRALPNDAAVRFEALKSAFAATRAGPG